MNLKLLTSLTLAVLVITGEIRAQTTTPESLSEMQATFMQVMELSLVKAGKKGSAAEITQFSQQTIRAYERDPVTYPRGDLFKAALAYGCQGQAGKAEELLKDVLEAAPENTDALRLLGTIYAHHHLFADAEKCLQNAIAKGDLDALQNLATVYLISTNLEKFRQLVPKMMENKGTHTNLIDILVSYTQWEQPPKNDLFCQLAKDRTDDQIVNRSGWSKADDGRIVGCYILGFWDSGDHKRALRLYSRVAEKYEAIVSYFIGTPERNKEIISDYEKDPAAWPKDCLLLVAAACQGLSEIEKAEQVYLKRLKIQPDDLDALRGLGVLYHTRDDDAAAVIQWKKAWGLGDGHSLYDLALTYLNNAEFKTNESKGHAEEMRKLVPVLMANKDKFPYLILPLVAYTQMEHPVKTELFLKIAKSLTDDQILNWPDVGKTNYVAITCFVAGFWNSGDQKRALRLQSLLWEKNEDAASGFDEPEDKGKEVISAYEKDPSAWPTEGQLIAAIAYLFNQEFEKALPLYAEVLKRHPDNQRALLGLAVAYGARKDYSTSVIYAKRAWELGDVQSLKILALNYLFLKDQKALKGLVPDLLKGKQEDLDMVSCLIGYAVSENPPDRAVFLQAVGGLTDDKILSNSNVVQAAIGGFKAFDFGERARVLQQKFDKQKK